MPFKVQNALLPAVSDVAAIDQGPPEVDTIGGELTWAIVCPVQGTIQRSFQNLDTLSCRFSFIWNID
jgi:hypothetical protein